MSCGQFRLWVVSDSLQDRQRARDHAAECDACREILRGHDVLHERVLSWTGQDAAPAELEEKIRQRIAAEARRPVVGPRPTTGAPPQRRSRLWLALAASFLLGVGLGVFNLRARESAPVETRRLLDASSLEIARQEEAAQVRVIADLEAQVKPILARARDKNLATHQAARLMEFRSRLASLDVTIDDVLGFVENNPGHPRARTMLLDAYREKKEVLREVIALEERSS